MATRKDPQIKEDITRGSENEQASAGTNSGNNNYNNEDKNEANESDTIKNANATGLGAMGRNDQKQTEDA